MNNDKVQSISIELGTMMRNVNQRNIWMPNCFSTHSYGPNRYPMTKCAESGEDTSISRYQVVLRVIYAWLPKENTEKILEYRII